MRYRAFIVAFLALCLGVLTACSEGPAAATSVPTPLTYDQIRGTGLANNCPQLSETTRGAIPIQPGQSYALTNLCLQPTSFFVKEESTNKRQSAQFVQGKLLTRFTSSIDQVLGKLQVDQDRRLTFIEQDGLDFQAITVQLPGGERVPFLFTIKNLVAKSQPGMDSINTSTDFEGEFNVPSYRGAAFLDPKGRGVVTGYDNAVALPSQADQEALTRANVKRAETLKGEISLQVAKVDNATGEIAGTFESEQPSDTDLGAGEAKEVKIRGIFYARISPDQA
ncbi:photosystem II manganese-stabilizing polypeptide [Coleofasciculus sp. FACHB-64]|jgi:photosystem II oxygen-evolving enhancer protein 1|uniref:photosystem II manganese-stabilizing polypeptide n=1 Tax=Cyanophyceae TaxID=3028117 RepID=UPI001682F858|nr:MULTISPECIES: photosystem II manganese-stabilizing polypeptide [unclassified Coleofasciculus]MBD1838165.1 photosystem II manganese-stabilizing polypeptide [Coleofasciculus sp. FACHB-501]MBD1881882.1 photosystem II manganese-stabilizing polypeptide [Coleofasciculus sp. FACHB-T130]MBD1889251.1 photosystem II manganese-stabilizing polypeptide [Coleofasciculus sp. FACHB-SPT9]MBD1897650.1 photosystem II manganese-stabilizing polypeptide [Coleofasciculus sp. FACHB-129]MBD1899365.1 photosystem II 